MYLKYIKIYIWKYFLPFCGLCFHFLIGDFWSINAFFFLILRKSNLPVFSFYFGFWFFVSYSENHCLIQFCCLISYLEVHDPSWVNFGVWCGGGVQFHSCICISSCPRTIFWEDSSLVHWTVLVILSKVSWLYLVRIYFWIFNSIPLI